MSSISIHHHKITTTRHENIYTFRKYIKHLTPERTILNLMQKEFKKSVHKRPKYRNT